MRFEDCMVSAVAQKAISQEEATELLEAWRAKHAQLKLTMGDAAAGAKARDDLAMELKTRAIEKRRKADLTEAARLTLRGRLENYKTRYGESDPFEAAMGVLSHYGYRDASSVRGRAEAITAASHAKVADAMFALRRKGLLGKREQALQSDMVKELHGEASGDATAKGMANSISTVFEDLRQRFNAAGGAIGKLENFGLPHSHDRLKVKALGRDGWKNTIRPLLDAGRMTDNLTNQPISAARLEDALDHAYENIVSEGRAHMQAGMMKGGSSLANQRQDERFFHFKDAESWLTYHKTAGQGDVTQAIFNHINTMSKDIATMELLGPNPAAMVEYMTQFIEGQVGKSEVGLPSVARKGMFIKDGKSQSAYARDRLEALYTILRGQPHVVSGFANTTSDIKNVLTSAQLGYASVVAFMTDPAIAAASRILGGLPITNNVGKMLSMLKTANREEIIRSGVAWDEYMHVMADELRFAGSVSGSRWSQWLADRSVTWSGLKPLTTGRSLVEARAWQGHFADLARQGRDFAKLDPILQNTMTGFGINATHWDMWRQAIDANGFVTPMEIIKRGGQVRYIDMKNALPADIAAETKALAWREAAEKLAEMTTSIKEWALPSNTPNTKSALTGNLKRGTISGELMEYALQYKGFGLSFTAHQLEAMAEISTTSKFGSKAGGAYIAGLAGALMVGAGVALYLKALIDGKDAPDISDPKFWVQALLQGGGFGLFGDFAKATENRFGQSMTEATSGPGMAFLSDTFKLTIGNVLELGGAILSPDPAGRSFNEQTNFGAETVQYIGRYTPVLSSHWATRAAYRRLVLDNLQYLVDPKADAAFKRQAQKAAKDGAGFWLPPGSMTPARLSPGTLGRTRMPQFNPMREQRQRPQ